ncbi:MAG: T9SS type A sorting domain-containing protein [Bacteroidetes bacterium]|nr:T9SS type A sorting domain-containing protein [Bacteroidota bacterium]
MKRHPVYIILAGLIAFIFILTASTDDMKNNSGAPAGNTNSPGDGQNCTHCMNGSATAVAGWITSDVPSTGYKNDSTYIITVTAAVAGTKGFEVSPQDLLGNLVGTLTAETDNHLVGSGKYVTHNSGKTANPAVWSFTWKAPSTGNDDITFYGAIEVTVPPRSTKTTTLVIHKSTVGTEAHQVPELKIWPNPTNGLIKIRSAEPLQQVTVLNSTGTILQFSEQASAEVTVDLSIYSDGIYFVRIKVNEKFYTQKVIRN